MLKSQETREFGQWPEVDQQCKVEHRQAIDPAQTVRLCGPLHRAVAPLYSRIDANHEESGTLAELRDTLLPKLLSGEIRVGEAEKLAEEVA